MLSECMYMNPGTCMATGLVGGEILCRRFGSDVLGLCLGVQKAVPPHSHLLLVRVSLLHRRQYGPQPWVSDSRQELVVLHAIAVFDRSNRLHCQGGVKLGAYQWGANQDTLLYHPPPWSPQLPERLAYREAVTSRGVWINTHTKQDRGHAQGRGLTWFCAAPMRTKEGRQCFPLTAYLRILLALKRQ